MPILLALVPISLWAGSDLSTASESIKAAYAVLQKDPSSLKAQRAYIAVFPSDFASFIAVFRPPDFEQLYDDCDEYILTLQDIGDTLPRETIQKILQLDSTAVWDTDAPNYLQDITFWLAREKPDLFLQSLLKLAPAQQRGVVAFLADGIEGPHPTLVDELLVRWEKTAPQLAAQLRKEADQSRKRAGAATSVSYGNGLSNVYPEISSAAVAIPPEIPLEKNVTVWSTFENRKATLVRSDATKIPYDQEIGSITIESPNRPKQYIRLRRFRGVSITWINDRLLYINCDIGHLAGVDAIFDAHTGKWLYRQTVSYGTD